MKIKSPDKFPSPHTQSPMVSVIIPTFNDLRDRLQTSIDSVLSQTYQNFELIVVDDGGITPFAGLDVTNSDPRVSFVKLGKNLGPSAARNRGAKRAKGELFAFLDSGDWWENEKLELQIKLFNEGGEDLVFVFCGAKIISPAFDLPLLKHPRRIPSSTDLLISNQITGSASSVMVRKKYFDQVGGFDEEHEVTEDRDLWYRLSREGKILAAPRILVNLDSIAGSRNKDLEGNRTRYWNFIQLHGADIDRQGIRRQVMAAYHTNFAVGYFSRQQLGRGFKDLLEGARYSPRMLLAKPALVAFLSLMTGIKYVKIVSWLKRYFLRQT